MCSNEVANDFFGANHGTGGECVLCAFSVDFVSDDPILHWIDFFSEAEPELTEFFFLEAAFEEGVLNAHSIIFADAGDLGQSFGAGDIVSDEAEHLFGAWGRRFVRKEGEGIEPP